MIETGVFAENRYFDVMVTVAKASPTDMLIEIAATNRGPEQAELHLLPTIWFRNTWSWNGEAERPVLRRNASGIEAVHSELGRYQLFLEQPAPLLFTENETNRDRVFGESNPCPYVKDGIGNAVLHGRSEAINPAGEGTKAAPHCRVHIAAGECATIRLRLTAEPVRADPFGPEFDRIIGQRRSEADAFFAALPGMA